MPKDPKRWQETIISSPFTSLTKQDVHDYYARPAVRDKILKAVRATGSKETILRQSFAPERVILRRKDHKGNIINLSGKKDFGDWNQMRMTEVHPVFGQTTNTLLADIDPGKNVPWEKTKAIAETIARTLATDQSTKSVQVQFSGDTGFYVKGLLKKKMDVNDARSKVKDLMQGIAQRPDVTLGKAKVDQIRIDTTPLKNRGSIKAPYSLSANTGLVAAPVALKDLGNVKREDFKIEKIKMAAENLLQPGTPSMPPMSPRIQQLYDTLRRAGYQVQYSPEKHPVRPELISVHRRAGMPGQVEVFTKSPEGKRQGRYFTEDEYSQWIKGEDISAKTNVPKAEEVKEAAEKIAKEEFAPGIPIARKIDPIPEIKNKAWTLSVQQHDAAKAGKHYDVRLVDPKSDKAHSFAVPRARLPDKKDRMLLAVQQPTHTADYALNFEGKIPAGTYGAGAVKFKVKPEPVNVVKANADRIHFERPDGRKYVLFRTQGNNWGFKQKQT